MEMGWAMGWAMGMTNQLDGHTTTGMGTTDDRDGHGWAHNKRDGTTVQGWAMGHDGWDRQDDQQQQSTTNNYLQANLKKIKNSNKYNFFLSF